MTVLCFKATSSYSAQNGVLWIGRSRIPWLGSLDGKGIPDGAFSGLFEPFGNESHGLKKTFTLRSFIFIMFDLSNGRRLRSCLLFFSTQVGDYYSDMLLRCGGRKMASSTPIKKKVIPLHVDMSRNKKRTKPYNRSFFTFTKDRCPVDLSDTHYHKFIAISKHSQTVGGLPQPRLLFSELISLRKLLITPNLKKKGENSGWPISHFRVRKIDKVNQGHFFI